MSAKERQRVADYKRRLRHRLNRRREDDGYADLLQVARLNVLMETGEHSRTTTTWRCLAEWLARAQWPSNDSRRGGAAWRRPLRQGVAAEETTTHPSTTKPVAPPANPSNLTRY